MGPPGCGAGGAALSGTRRLSVVSRRSPPGLSYRAGLRYCGFRPVVLRAVAATVLLLRWPWLHPLALFAASGALFGLVGLW